MSKVQLQGNVSGTGVFTIASPNSNTDRTLTLPDNTGTLLTSGSSILASQLPAGSVIQAVQGTLTGSFSTSSSSDQATGLTASITPRSASNKIMVIVTPMLRATGGQGYVWFKLWRGAVTSGTLLFDGYPVVGGQSVSDFRGVGAFTMLDSPATTSSVTYSTSINSTFASTAYITSSTTPSNIILLEVVA